jgi:hypothetical protein
MFTRRQLLQSTGQGFGALALSSLSAAETSHRSQVIAPKAKRVVQLFMGGAASHIDLFDFKPALIKHHGEDSNFGETVEAFQNGLGPWKKPVWDFKPYGQSGRMLSEAVAPLGACADDMAFVHNMVGKTGVHSQGTLLQATGFNLPGFPGVGCWVSYALGSLSENLPTFVVLPDHRGFASNGPKNWDSAFLPSQHAGTIIYPGAEVPIADLFPHKSGRYISARSDRSGFELLKQMNRQHMAMREEDSRLESRIQSYELAAKMQLAAPEALDISKEPEKVKAMYGIQDHRKVWPTEINPEEEADYMGRKCLAARRLLERGVRFVQIWSGNDNGFPRRNWDSHEDVERDHGPLGLGHGEGRLRVDFGSETARFAGRYDHPLDHRVWPDAEHARRQRSRPQSLRFHELALRRWHQRRRHRRRERSVGLQAARPRQSDDLL